MNSLTDQFTSYTNRAAKLLNNINDTTARSWNTFNVILCVQRSETEGNISDCLCDKRQLAIYPCDAMTSCPVASQELLSVTGVNEASGLRSTDTNVKYFQVVAPNKDTYVKNLKKGVIVL